jgi:hypothetical protein
MWSQLDDLAREPIKMLPKEMTGRLLPLAPNDILDCIPLTNTTHTHWTETELGFLAYFGNKIISHFFGYSNAVEEEIAKQFPTERREF